jgi:hypothetical protein
MKRATLALTLVLALLVPVATALAALPKPADPTGVVPTSIAGMKLGLSEAKAKAAWGAAGATCSETRCYWGKTDSPQGYAYIEFFEHKVLGISVYGGRGKEGVLLSTAAKPIMAMKAKNGVGIGSKISQVKAAYPKGTQSGGPGDSTFYWTVKGKGGAMFDFIFDGASKQAVALVLHKPLS